MFLLLFYLLRWLNGDSTTANAPTVVYTSRVNLTTYRRASISAIAGNSGLSLEGEHLHFAIVDTLWLKGAYYGYATNFNGNKCTYGGVTYYNPCYVINNNRLP